MKKESKAITFELVPEAELPATKEVSQIESMRSEIAAFMAPELEAEIDKIIEDAKTIVAVTDEAGAAIAKASATALQKARTQKVEAPHRKFKAPITAIGSTLDARKRSLSQKLEIEEGHVRGLISKFEQAEEEKKQEAIRLHREKVTGRINEAIKAGVQVDADFADLASDEEWASALSKAIDEKAKADEIRLMVVRAATHGFVLPIEDIEHMDLLIAAGELADREAGLMLWLGAAAENRRKQDAALRTERRMVQCEELGIEVAASTIRKATDSEWDAIVAATQTPAVAPAEALEPVLHADATPAPSGLPAASPAPVVARVVTSEPPAPADTDERLAKKLPLNQILSTLAARPEPEDDGWGGMGYSNQEDAFSDGVEVGKARVARMVIADLAGELEQTVKAPAIEVLRKLSEFGKTHCAQKGHLRTDFVEIFQAMRSYVEAL